MAQQRFFNYKEDDSTFLLSQRLTGYFVPGRYAGYDFTPTASMNLLLGHSVTGMQTRDLNGAVKTVGVAQSNQGCTIFEDANLSTLPINPTSTDPRIDIIVMTHNQTTNQGGALAQYAVVQGTASPTPVKPSIPTPNTQIEIGALYLPSNTTALNQVGVTWTQSKVSALETKLDADDFDIEKALLDGLDSNIIEALGRSLSFQDTINPTGSEPALPPILLCGGTNDAFTVVGGFIYYNGELLILENGYVFADQPGSLVFDIIGTSPFRIAQPRMSVSPDGDFSASDLVLPIDYINSRIEGVWINITPLNGWLTNVSETAGFNRLQFKSTGNKRELRGCIFLDGGALPSSNVLYTLNVANRPIGENRFAISHDTSPPGATGYPEEFQYATIGVKANGEITLKTPYSPQASSLYFLDGISWTID